MSTPESVLPPGEYAIVELFGHSTLVGRVEEVERFGTTMLAIEPLFAGAFLPTIFHGGASIYRFTPCSAEVAFERQATREYQLPLAVRAIIPPLAITSTEQASAAPSLAAVVDVEEDCIDE